MLKVQVKIADSIHSCFSIFLGVVAISQIYPLVKSLAKLEKYFQEK